MIDELSEFLGELAGAGSIDSRGHFSLDIEKAREKLRRFQLPTPHHYVLCILSAACAGGARTLHLATDGLDTVARIDGLSFRFDDLKDLFGAFLTGASQEPLRIAIRELAMAVHGARALDPELIRVESWGQGAGARLQVRGNTMEVEPLTESPFDDLNPQTLVCVRERQGFLATLRLICDQARGVRGPAEDILTSAGRFAETTVRVHGRPINITRLGNWPAVARLNPEGPVRSPELLPRKSTFQRTLQLKCPFAGYLGFGEGPGGVLVIVSGVLFQPTLPLGYSTARAIVYAPYLARDLSQSQLLEDQAYAQFASHLASSLDRLVEEVVETGMGLAAWMEHPLREYLLRRQSLAEVPVGMRMVNLVPLANQQLTSLENIQASYARHQRLAWCNPPGYPRGQDPRMPDGTLILMRTPQLGEALDRLFPNH